jgi:hypothetical protein
MLQMQQAIRSTVNVLEIDDSYQRIIRFPLSNAK